MWICLCISSNSPGFESQAHHLCFFHLLSNLYLFLYCEMDENWQKEGRDCRMFKFVFRYSTYCFEFAHKFGKIISFMTIWLKITEKKFFSNRSQNKNVSILSFEIFAEPGKQKAVKLTPYLPTHGGGDPWIKRINLCREAISAPEFEDRNSVLNLSLSLWPKD